MIEVRLFAGLRQGRQKIYQMEPDSIATVQDIMDRLSIERKEVNILLINGFHQKPETRVKDGDIVSLFPAVGGG
jgi:molybdopterin converting factor small subunit